MTAIRIKISADMCWMTHEIIPAGPAPGADQRLSRKRKQDSRNAHKRTLSNGFNNRPLVKR